MLEFLLSMVLAVVSVLLALVGAGYFQSPKALKGLKIADKMHNDFHDARKNKIGLYQIKSPRAAHNPRNFADDLDEARAHLKAAKRSDMKLSSGSGKLGPEEIWADIV